MINPAMIKKLQGDLQNRIEKMNDELAQVEVEGTAGGGVVKVIATGDRVIKRVVIGPEAIDPDDPDMLQDLIMAATNQAMEKAKKLHEESVSQATGGLHFPGLF